MIIYKTTNLVNNKIYIGKDRKNNPKYLGSGLILRKAIKKHGIDNFVKETIECCTEENIDEREIYWISFYNSTDRNVGYNLTKGGTGGDTFTHNPNKQQTVDKLREKSTGRTHSQEAKDKTSKARLGSGNGMFGKTPWNKNKPMSDEVKEKISKANKGQLLGITKSQAVKDAVSKAQKGKPKSQEHKDKISETLKNKRCKNGH